MTTLLECHLNYSNYSQSRSGSYRRDRPFSHAMPEALQCGSTDIQPKGPHRKKIVDMASNTKKNSLG